MRWLYVLALLVYIIVSSRAEDGPKYCPFPECLNKSDQEFLQDLIDQQFHVQEESNTLRNKESDTVKPQIVYGVDSTWFPTNQQPDYQGLPCLKKKTCFGKDCTFITRLTLIDQPPSRLWKSLVKLPCLESLKILSVYPETVDWDAVVLLPEIKHLSLELRKGSGSEDIKLPKSLERFELTGFDRSSHEDYPTLSIPPFPPYLRHLSIKNASVTNLNLPENLPPNIENVTMKNTNLKGYLPQAWYSSISLKRLEIDGPLDWKTEELKEPAWPMLQKLDLEFSHQGTFPRTSRNWRKSICGTLGENFGVKGKQHVLECAERDSLGSCQHHVTLVEGTLSFDWSFCAEIFPAKDAEFLRTQGSRISSGALEVWTSGRPPQQICTSTLPERVQRHWKLPRRVQHVEDQLEIVGAKVILDRSTPEGLFQQLADLPSLEVLEVKVIDGAWTDLAALDVTTLCISSDSQITVGPALPAGLMHLALSNVTFKSLQSSTPLLESISLQGDLQEVPLHQELSPVLKYLTLSNTMLTSKVPSSWMDSGLKVLNLLGNWDLSKEKLPVGDMEFTFCPMDQSLLREFIDINLELLAQSTDPKTCGPQNVTFCDGMQSWNCQALPQSEVAAMERVVLKDSGGSFFVTADKAAGDMFCNPESGFDHVHQLYVDSESWGEQEKDAHTATKIPCLKELALHLDSTNLHNASLHELDQVEKLIILGSKGMLPKSLPQNLKHLEIIHQSGALTLPDNLRDLVGLKSLVVDRDAVVSSNPEVLLELQGLDHVDACFEDLSFGTREKLCRRKIHFRHCAEQICPSPILYVVVAICSTLALISFIIPWFFAFLTYCFTTSNSPCWGDDIEMNFGDSESSLRATSTRFFAALIYAGDVLSNLVLVALTFPSLSSYIMLSIIGLDHMLGAAFFHFAVWGKDATFRGGKSDKPGILDKLIFSWSWRGGQAHRFAKTVMLTMFAPIVVDIQSILFCLTLGHIRSSIDLGEYFSDRLVLQGWLGPPLQILFQTVAYFVPFFFDRGFSHVSYTPFLISLIFSAILLASSRILRSRECDDECNEADSIDDHKSCMSSLMSYLKT